MESQKIGAAAAQDARAAKVFSRYGLDYCCEGQKSLEQACADANPSLEDVLADIQAPSPRKRHESPEDFSALPPDAPTRHIEEVHPRYTEDAVEIISVNLSRLVRFHG